MIKLKLLTARESDLTVEELERYKIGAIDALQRKMRLKRRNKRPGKGRK